MNRQTVAALACVLALVCLVAFAGCSAQSGGRAPYVNASIPHLGEFLAGGDASEPASFHATTGGTAFDVPAGAAVVVGADGSLSFTAAEAVRIETRTASASIGGPVAYPPPAAPSPSDDADATARLWAWIAAGLGVVGLTLGALKGWPLVRTGGLCLAGAAVAIISLQAIPLWVWAIVGAGILLAVAGPLLWRFRIRAQVETAAVTPQPAAA